MFKERYKLTDTQAKNLFLIISFVLASTSLRPYYPNVVI